MKGSRSRACLEFHPQADLNGARLIALCGDHAECGRRCQVQPWVAVLDGVEEVEDVGGHDPAYVSHDLQALADRQVHVPARQAIQRSTSGTGVLADGNGTELAVGLFGIREDVYAAAAGRGVAA